MALDRRLHGSETACPLMDTRPELKRSHTLLPVFRSRQLQHDMRGKQLK